MYLHVYDFDYDYCDYTRETVEKRAGTCFSTGEE
jgi:hypothetical protein